MLQKEETHGGGILADEMGLGKTGTTNFTRGTVAATQYRTRGTIAALSTALAVLSRHFSTALAVLLRQCPTQTEKSNVYQLQHWL